MTTRSGTDAAPAAENVPLEPDPTDDWLEIRLTGTAPDRDRLLREVARPLLTSMAPDRPGFFLPAPGTAPSIAALCVQLRPETEEESRACLSQARERARAIGGIEVTAGPARLVPLAGSVFAGPRLGPVTRSVLASACPALLELTVAAERGRPALLWAATELMAAHLRGVSTAGPATVQQLMEGREGVPLGFLSYRSHAEAFVASSRDPQGAQAMLEQKYERVAPRVEPLVEGVLAQAEGRGPVVSPAAATWFQAVHPVKAEVTEDFRAGRLRLQDEGPDPANVGNLKESSFHRVVAGSDGLQRFLNEDPTFLATRLLTSLLYVGLQAGGIALAERYFLCYAVSRACEALFGVNALAVVTALARGTG
nr:NosO [Streptomyces sp.]